MQIKINDDLHFFQCEYQVFGEALENIFFFMSFVSKDSEG